VAYVQAETSTGAFQPGHAICEAAHEVDALAIADCVTSLGGMPVRVDETGIDIAYSCTQKGLGCPPGLAPLTVSPRAWERLRKRTAPVDSFYMDLRLLESYFRDRKYHHTASATMFYALREALAIVREEGIENRWERHRRNHEAFVAGIEAMGLRMHVAAGHRLWTLNTPRVPDGRERCQGAPAAAERIRHRDRRRLRTAGRQGVPYRVDGLLIHRRECRQGPGCVAEDDAMKAMSVKLLPDSIGGRCLGPGAHAWTPELSMQVQPVGDVVPSPDGKLVAYTQSHAVIETEKSEIDTQIFSPRPTARIARN
jgi:hypothetical protein